MDPVDRTLTHSIIGAPVSILLGRPAAPGAAASEGISVQAQPPGWRLGADWQQQWALHPHDEDFAGVRRRPGRVRLWLERHALVLGMLALLVLLLEALAWLAWRTGVL